MSQLSTKLSEAKHFLKTHEWLAIIAFVGWLITLVIITNASNQLSSHLGTPHQVTSGEIEVFIEGAVARPGTYRLKKGALLKEVLTLAKPTPDADLRRLKPESKLRDGRIIKVSSQKKKSR